MAREMTRVDLRTLTLAMATSISAIVAIVACHRPPRQAAPDPSACAVDADCTFGVGIDESGCCFATNSATSGAHSVAFERWVTERVASAACKGSKCEPLPPPSPPPPGVCWNTPRCRQGRCGDACGS
jgi:hypothetical protein